MDAGGWALLVLGSVMLAVSELWLAKATPSRGLTTWGLARPPGRAVALRVVGVGIVTGAVIWNIDHVAWGLLALAAAWLPAIVVVIVFRRRERQAAAADTD